MNFEDMYENSEYGSGEQTARRAFELYEEGKIPQVLLVLEDALQANPSSSALHFNKALALDSANRFEDAAAEYQTALELNPLDTEILNCLAVDYTRLGQYDLAIDTFEQIQQINPDFEPCYCNRIITYAEMGLHDQAEQMFYLAQQIEADCPLCYYNIGNSLYIRGQYDKAVSCWQKTVELEPTHPQINYRIAQASWFAGKFQEARQAFIDEIKTNPDNTDAIFDFGLFLLEQEDIESAKEKFTRLVEFTSDHANALFYLGEIAFNEGNLDKAISYFDRAQIKNPSLPGTHYRLAQCALMRGQNFCAKEYLIAEAKLMPKNADVLVSMASMFLSIDELELAESCLLRAVDIDFGHANAYYYLGIASVIKGQLEDALEFFTHTLDINKEHIWALKDSAIIYLKLGRLEQASERTKKALKLAGNDPQLISLLRKILVSTTIKSVTDFFRRFLPRFTSKKIIR